MEGIFAHSSTMWTIAHNVAEHVHEDYTQFTKLPYATFAGKKLGVPRYMIFDSKYWEYV